MCKYCKVLDYTKDYNSRYPTLAEIKVVIGGMSLGKFSFCISDESGSGEPHIEMYDGDIENVKAIKKINYCPMCGEKLKVIR